MTPMTKRLRNTSLTLSAAALSMAASVANADQVILDDLIVDGSICAGLDCVNGESFGFDTLRLKENNLRIKFQDTSASASFPSNDWQITANDSSNGGANKFSIDDIDGGRTPFTIEASAPSHSLYVDDGGRIGFGKSTPVVQLHLADGNTPTLRLEQDGTSGFTPQTWDLAGNESNFFIRDATNGSALALRIFPGSGTANALNIAADGDIGLGTTSPDGPLHIRDNSVYMTLDDADNGDKWFMTHAAGDAGNLEFTNELDGSGSFTLAFVVEPDGDTRVAGNLGIADSTAAAPAPVSGRAILYVDNADGDLKVIFGDGVVRTIATD